MTEKYPRHGRSIYRTERWKAVRLQAKRRDNWQCVKCGAKTRLEVDHIIPLRDQLNLAYDLDNLQTLCASCHTKKTRIDIGMPPPDPERVKWLKAIADLQNKG